MKYRIVSYTLIFCVLALLFVMLIFHSGNNMIKTGEMFYDLDNVSYVLNFEKNESHKVEIKPYKEIRNYFPYEDGFLAIGITDDKYGNLFPDSVENHDNTIERGDILYNDGNKTIVLSSEFSPDELVVINGYLFFHTADEKLIAVNLSSKERIVINKQFLNYTVIDEYFVYSTYDEMDTSNIYYIDCKKNGELKSEYIDNGVIQRNAIDNLVYKKDKELYQYCFKNNSIKRIKYYDFKKDSESITYIGTFNYNKKVYDVFVNHPHFTNVKKADRVFNYEIKYYFVPIYQQLIIQSGKQKMKLSLPNSKQLRVTAFKDNSSVSYLNKQSLNHFGLW